MERQGRLRRRWIFKPTGTGADAQGVMLFWDDTLKAWVPTTAAELIWDDTAKILKAASVQITSLTETRVLFAGASGVISDDAGMTYALATDILTAGTYNATDEDDVLQVDGSCVFKTGTVSDDNIFLGRSAGKLPNTGFENVAVGVGALLSLTSGNRNFALGTSALGTLQNGARNIAIGAFAMDLGTSISKSVAIGYQAGRTATSEQNIFIGNFAGLQVSAGRENVLIGNTVGQGTSLNTHSFNVMIGGSSGLSITTGSNNLFLGYKSGYNQTTNSNLLIIDNQDRGSAATELTNCMIYGVYNATVTSQTLRFNVGNLSIVSGTPYQYLINDTHEDSDGGRESRINFKGEQSGGELTTLARIQPSHDGTADDEKGKIERYINTGSDGDSPTLAETIESNLDVFWTKAKITAIGGYAVKLTNNTGVNSVEGQLVEADGTDENSYKVADTNSVHVVGFVYNAGVADGSEVWIVTGGIAKILVDAGGCIHHDRLIASVTAGSADVSNTPSAADHFKEVGHAIETVVGAGLAKAMIHLL